MNENKMDKNKKENECFSLMKVNLSTNFFTSSTLGSYFEYQNAFLDVRCRNFVPCLELQVRPMKRLDYVY